MRQGCLNILYFWVSIATYHYGALAQRLKTVTLILLLLSFALSPDLQAQSGGRKREGGTRAKRSFSLKRKHSAGHADKFARSTGRKGLFARLFHKDQPAWTYRKKSTNKSNWKENRTLFSRHRSPGQQENARQQAKQNAKRAKQRDRGNVSFSKRKHGR